MESAGSAPVKSFYESLVQRVMGDAQFQFEKDPLAMLEAAASEDVPSYKPRFDYDSYSKDSTETKLKGNFKIRKILRRRQLLAMCAERILLVTVFIFASVFYVYKILRYECYLFCYRCHTF